MSLESPSSSETMIEFDPSAVVIRLATAADQASVERLFRRGGEEGLLRENDTGADIRNLQNAYLSEPDASGFWVAESDGRVIGMIGVQRTSDAAADIRRLRVQREYRLRGIGSRLTETAIDFCRENSVLKIVLDVRVERAPAIRIFEKFGFSLSKDRQVDGRRTLDFYLDLYRESPGY
ncbi:MAG: GNAT family N-acetyltransferase [Phycisphaerales bacterium]